jgi:hypothetical protein
MDISRCYIAIVLSVIVLLISVRAKAQSPRAVGKMPKEFVPFQTFYEDTQRATFGKYAMMTGNVVANYVDFAEMQTYILSMYEGAEVKNSFVLGNDHIDCVDVTTQPSLKQNGKQIPVAKPPPHPDNADDNWGRGLAGRHGVLTLLSEQKKDAYGNVQFCEE